MPVAMQVLLTAHRQQLHAAEIEQLRHSLDASAEPALPVRRRHDLSPKLVGLALHPVARRHTLFFALPAIRITGFARASILSASLLFLELLSTVSLSSVNPTLAGLPRARLARLGAAGAARGGTGEWAGRRSTVCARV